MIINEARRGEAGRRKRWQSCEDRWIDGCFLGEERAGAYVDSRGRERDKDVRRPVPAADQGSGRPAGRTAWMVRVLTHG